MSLTRQEALARLDEIAKLEANWDTYGCPPIAPAVIERARNWVLAVDVPPDAVCPAGDGSILLEWVSGPLAAEVWVYA